MRSAGFGAPRQGTSLPRAFAVRSLPLGCPRCRGRRAVEQGSGIPCARPCPRQCTGSACPASAMWTGRCQVVVLGARALQQDGTVAQPSAFNCARAASASRKLGGPGPRAGEQSSATAKPARRVCMTVGAPAHPAQYAAQRVPQGFVVRRGSGATCAQSLGGRWACPERQGHATGSHCHALSKHRTPSPSSAMLLGAGSPVKLNARQDWRRCRNAQLWPQ